MPKFVSGDVLEKLENGAWIPEIVATTPQVATDRTLPEPTKMEVMMKIWTWTTSQKPMNWSTTKWLDICKVNKS